METRVSASQGAGYATGSRRLRDPLQWLCQCCGVCCRAAPPPTQAINDATGRARQGVRRPDRAPAVGHTGANAHPHRSQRAGATQLLEHGPPRVSHDGAGDPGCANEHSVCSKCAVREIGYGACGLLLLPPAPAERRCLRARVSETDGNPRHSRCCSYCSCVRLSVIMKDPVGIVTLI